jgi:hypothetical protein
VSRFDKYDPVSGGFRAPLNAAIAAADVGKIQAVSINGSGKVVMGGAAETAIIGVVVAVRPMAANDPIDVMTSGEIVEATTTAGAAFVAGAVVSVATGASTGAVASAAGKIIGRVIEATRVVIRCPVSTT